MDIKRVAKHLLATDWRVRRAFPRRTLDAIEQAIKSSETAHTGEIRFVVEGALEVFSELRVWDTEHNNGVLIYLLLADRDVEIVADRGIHAKVGTEEWERICRRMETAFARGDYESGVIDGIQEVTRHLIGHFASAGGERNELPDRPVVF